MVVSKEIKIIYESFNRQAFTQSFVLPDGKVKEYLMLDFTRDSPVIILPVTEGMGVLVIEVFRPGASRYILELPGGIPEKGETLLDAAQRELLEETGHSATNFHLLAEDIWFEPATLRIKYNAFLALNCKKQSQYNVDINEPISHVHTIPFKEWLRKIWIGSVTDSKSIAVTLLALKHEELRACL